MENGSMIHKLLVKK